MMSPPTHYRWEAIRDYEVEPSSLEQPELRSLAGVWEEQRQVLEENQGVISFNQRLRREWAIETGLLERIYTLDRGVTRILIERGIDASYVTDNGGGQDPNRVVAIIRDHEAAMEGLFAFVKGDRVLSPGYVKELHALLTRHQETTTAIDSLGRLVEMPLVKGAYKTQPNNPTRPNGAIHQYCPPEHVAFEMERLLEMHSQHVGVSAEVEAAWLHHRFTQVHPFQDGNGRVALCLATLALIKAGWFPLVVRDTKEERGRYLDALEEADGGRLKSLVSLFASTQKRAFVQALGASGEVLRSRRAEHLVSATRDLLIERNKKRRADWDKAKDVAGHLQTLAFERLNAIRGHLEKETHSLPGGFSFRVDQEPADGGRGHYFRWQIIEAAKRLDYFANTAEYRAWVRLILNTESQAEILVSFHGAGREFRGILAVSASFFRREATEVGEREIVDLKPLSSEIFQVNYRESRQAIEIRFREWLEEILVAGLEVWRSGL